MSWMDTPEPRESGPPFDRPDANIIIQSSDQVNFRVHKLVLKLASPVFETMFSLPQGTCPKDNKNKDDLQVLQLGQDSRTLRKLLEICYPGLPSCTEIEDVGNIIKAAHFYQMTNLLSQLQHMISTTRHLAANPIRVYSIACRWGWKELAENAARVALQKDIAPLIICPEMDDISANTLVRLINYHNSCGAVAKATANTMILLLRDKWPSVGYMHKANICDCTKPPEPGSHPIEWWNDYLKDVGNRLEKRPCKEAILSYKVSLENTANTVKCRSCLLKIGDYIPVFNERLWSAVKEKIDKVKLDFVVTSKA